MKIVKKGLVALVTILLGVLLVINVYSFISIKILGKDLPIVFGHSTLEVVSGSMEPTIHIGDMIVINTNDKNYKEGDIITFYDREGSFVTHRIISIDGDTVVTKGDNNNSIDEAFKTNKIVGKWIFTISNGGKVLHALKNPLGVGMIFITGILVCMYFSLDKNGVPILTKEEREKEMFKKNKKFEKFTDNDNYEFSEFDEELDLELEKDYDELMDTEEDNFGWEYEEDNYQDEEYMEEEYEDNYSDIEPIEDYEEEYEEEMVDEEELATEEEVVVSDISSLEEFRKYKEQQELEEFRRYKAEKELEEFKKYKADKEMEEFRRFEEEKKKLNNNNSKPDYYKKNSNNYKKNNKNYKKKN